MELLTKEIMLKALRRLEQLLPHQITLIIGGGGALLLTDQFPLATADIDAVPKGIGTDELGDYVKQVAMELAIPGDWLNPYFSSFTHVLPQDFETRLIEIFVGVKLKVRALGKEDLLIMKCFAHRQKDIPHARALIRNGANSQFVSDHIEGLKKHKVQGIQAALDFLDDILESEDTN